MLIVVQMNAPFGVSLKTSTSVLIRVTYPKGVFIILLYCVVLAELLISVKGCDLVCLSYLVKSYLGCLDWKIIKRKNIQWDRNLHIFAFRHTKKCVKRNVCTYSKVSKVHRTCESLLCMCGQRLHHTIIVYILRI